MTTKEIWMKDVDGTAKCRIHEYPCHKCGRNVIVIEIDGWASIKPDEAMCADCLHCLFGDEPDEGGDDGETVSSEIS